MRTSRPSRIRRIASAGLLTGLLAFLGAGCSLLRAPADRHFTAGAWAEAEGAYRQALQRPGGLSRDRMLFRLGLLYALPGSPVQDPGKARQTLSRLVRSYPESPYSMAARAMLGLVQDLETLREAVDESRAQVADAAARLEALGRELEATEAAVEQRDERNRYLMQTLEAQRQEVGRLASQLEEGDERLEQLRRELERLKEIDLSGPP